MELASIISIVTTIARFVLKLFGGGGDSDKKTIRKYMRELRAVSGEITTILESGVDNSPRLDELERRRVWLQNELRNLGAAPKESFP